MSSLEDLAEEMRKLSREMLSSSVDLHQVAERLGVVEFHKGFVGKPSIPQEEASVLERGLDEVGHDILVLVDDIVGWAERAAPFQVRSSEWDEKDSSSSKYGVVQLSELHEQIDLGVLVAEARTMMKTINSISSVLDKGLHHLQEPEVRSLGKSLEHYANWLQRNGTKLGGAPSGNPPAAN